MKKIAVIIASGVGSRMGLDIPKQFVSIKVDYEDGYSEEKEVLAYTLEEFQQHELIDEICVVTLAGWEQHVLELGMDCNITKLKSIVTGGETVQESIRNGIFSLEGVAKGEDIIIIHDGVRPIIDDDVLTDVIETAEKKGNAVTSQPYNEQMFIIDKHDSTKTRQYINRDKLRRVSTPQAYNFDLINGAYHEAFEKKIGISPPAYTNNMMVDLGYVLNLASGSDKNIKLTTIPDITAFKAFKQDEYMRGKEKAKVKVRVKA